jgi:hypothetical protein
VRGVGYHHPTRDEAEVRNGCFYAGTGGAGNVLWSVEDVGYGPDGYLRASCDVDQLGAGTPGTGGAPAAEDVCLAMARARRWAGPGEVVEDQVGQPGRHVDGAVAIFLGRAPHQLAGVELVQLPFDPNGARPHELGL